MNKIAVFVTRRNKEYLSYLYRGLSAYKNEHSVVIHMYLCFGKMGMGKTTDRTVEEIKHGFYQFPDLRQYDGVIIPMTTMMENGIENALLRKVKEAGIPCVTIEAEYEGMSWVGINQCKAVQDIMEHMIQCHGASKFCYLGGTVGTYEAEVRKAAFLKALKENDLPVYKEWVLDGRYQYEDGVEAGKKILEESDRMKPIPDTVICANDEMAAGVYDVISQSRLQGEIGVAGFDFYRNGEYYRPYLTTIVRPRDEVGYESCRLMEKMISKGHSWVGRKELKYQIRVGNTCGCCIGEIDNESEVVRRIFSEEHQKNVMLEQIEWMEERTTRDVHRTELAEGILEAYRFLGGNYVKIMISKEMLENDNTDYSQCDDTLVEWTEQSYDKSNGEFLVFSPLHFQSRIIGYACMAGIDALIYYGLLEIFLKNICFSMENYIQKKRYSKINKHYQELFMTDQLTGLYNRFGLKEYGYKLYDANCAAHLDTHIIFCDINRLKYINDTYGHQAGDWAICAVGKALKACQTLQCLPFRYGGDEFIVLAGAAPVQTVILDIKQQLEKLQADEPQEYHVEISVGSFTASWDKQEPLETYFIKADEVMYQERSYR